MANPVTILALGENAVGKTAFCNSYIGLPLDEHYRPTLGMDIREKSQVIPGNAGIYIPIQYFDVSGDALDDKRLINAILLADIILLMYDITHIGSFYRLEGVINEIHSMYGLNAKKFSKSKLPYLGLVATKADLEVSRTIHQNLHDRFVSDYQIKSSFFANWLKPELTRQWIISIAIDYSGIKIEPEYSQKKAAKPVGRKRIHSLVGELKAIRGNRDEDSEAKPAFCSYM